MKLFIYTIFSMKLACIAHHIYQYLIMPLFLSSGVRCRDKHRGAAAQEVFEVYSAGRCDHEGEREGEREEREGGL